jgi:hypothetical protein
MKHKGRNLQKGSANAWSVDLPEKFDSSSTNVYRTPDIDFKLVTGDIIGSRFYFSDYNISRIIENHVDVTEDFLGFVERSSDISCTANIYLEDKQFILGIFGREVREHFWFAESSSNSFPVL